MRLALVERYLRAADEEQTAEGKKTQLERASFHAGEAAARATTASDQALGAAPSSWTTALLTDPAKGAGYLERPTVKGQGTRPL